MKPPHCHFCGEPSGQTLRFADYEPLPEGTVGHPRGLEWICDAHLAQARELTSLSTQDAMARMRGESRRDLLTRLFRRHDT